METIITINNVDTGEYFFTTDHCQPHNLGKQWVPVTTRLPMTVVPRRTCPDGIVGDRETYVKVFHASGREIRNPESNFQA